MLAFRAHPLATRPLAARAHPPLLVLFTPARSRSGAVEGAGRHQKDQEPWPEPDEQQSSKKVSADTARNNKKIPGTDSTLKEHHLDKKTLFKHHLEFKKGNQQATCKFSERPKYDIQVKKPNVFDLDWLYSVPCGQNMEGQPVPVLDRLESP